MLEWRSDHLLPHYGCVNRLGKVKDYLVSKKVERERERKMPLMLPPVLCFTFDHFILLYFSTKLTAFIKQIPQFQRKASFPLSWAQKQQVFSVHSIYSKYFSISRKTMPKLQIQVQEKKKKAKFILVVSTSKSFVPRIHVHWLHFSYSIFFGASFSRAKPCDDIAETLQLFSYYNCANSFSFCWKKKRTLERE